jgi:non-specific serine/threonine protein kinase
MGLRIRLFGHLNLSTESGTPIPALRPRAGRLLVYLLLNRHKAIPRESAAFTLWPDDPEKESLGSLRRALNDLRSALPSFARRDWVIATRTELRWNPDSPHWLDIDAFERLSREGNTRALREAVDLYTDDLLVEFDDEWAVIERERLRQLLVESLDRLITMLEEARDYRLAVNYAQRLLRSDPLREETYRWLMRLHALSGDRAGALRVYQTCVAVLKQEIDTDVSQTTRDAFEQAMRWDSDPTTAGDIRPQPRTDNLPFQLTSFIGRERELAEVKRLLRQTRFLTLTGPGGCGKTRLAMQAASEMAAAMRDGVWLVELASLSDPALVSQSVASVLGIREQAGRPLSETLATHLQSKALLLILDNCEHLLAAAAHMAESCLRTCATVQILAASRERLNVAGEVVWPVPSLSLPDSSDLTPDTLSQFESIQLFVERAVSVSPTFELSHQNAAPIAQICRRLDGIPLAIELAAARVRMLTPDDIVARLGDAFRLLTGGSQAAPPRQQTLRATMDWSYRLLSEHEQMLLRRLSVFAGGWSLDAAESVCADAGLESPQILELLSQLIDKSLVVVEAHGSQARYRLLDTIRQYAHDQLLEAGESERARERHCQFFLKFVEGAKSKLIGPEQVKWLNRIDAEHDNLRAALAYALDNEKVETGLRLVVALGVFWRMRNYLTEGRRWAEHALAHSEALAHTELRAWALNALMHFARVQGDYVTARSLTEESLALFRELEDTRGVADAFKSLGLMAWHQSDYAAAQSIFEQSLALCQEIDDRLGMADALHHLGHVVLDQGRYAHATRFFRESVALYREAGDTLQTTTLVGDLGLSAYLQEDYATARSFVEESLAFAQEEATNDAIAECLNRLGDLARCEGDDTRAEALYQESLVLFQQIGLKPHLAGTLHNLGYIALHRRDYGQAAARFTESLKMLQDIGDRKGMAECLMGLAGLACALDDSRRAARLFGAAEAQREALGATLWPANRLEYERNLASLRAQLTEDAIAQTWAEGRQLSLAEAISLATQKTRL